MYRESQPAVFVDIMCQNLLDSRNALKEALIQFITYHSIYKDNTTMQNLVENEGTGTSISALIKPFLEGNCTKPLYECYVNTNDYLICDVELSAHVLRRLAVIDFIINMFAHAMKTVYTSSLQQKTSMKALCEIFKPTPGYKDLIESIIHDLYVNSQIDMSHVKEESQYNPELTRPRVHPVYRLLVTARDSLVVKDGPDETSKRVCRYDRGTIILAYERIVSNNNMIKYRTDEGWISYLKSVTSLEVQIEVIDVLAKTPEQSLSEIQIFQKEANEWSILKRFNYEKLMSISGSRSVLMSLYHFHTSIRQFLTCITRTLIDTGGQNYLGASYTRSEENTKFAGHTTGCIQMLIGSLDSLLQPLPVECISTNTPEEQFKKLTTGHGMYTLPFIPCTVI